MIISARDCGWSEWVTGNCSVSCGHGAKNRTRTKIITEINGGKCIGDSIAIEHCKEKDCPSRYSYFFEIARRSSMKCIYVWNYRNELLYIIV